MSRECKQIKLNNLAKFEKKQISFENHQISEKKEMTSIGMSKN